MSDLDALVKVLRAGGVVACPTETWLGLLADARNEAAIEKVAALKGRPADMPIALLLPSAEGVAEVALPPSRQAEALMRDHWPGPLTLLLHAKPGLSPRLVRDGKVGVRVPGSSPAADLVRAFGHALTATSANPTGEPPVRSATELPVAMVRQLDGVVRGRAPGGLPSTLVDTTVAPITVLRSGPIEIDTTAL